MSREKHSNCVDPKDYPFTDADIARFFRYIRKEDSGCWLWTGYQNAGYGYFSLNNGYLGSHRFSVIAFKKQIIPENQKVLHTCDNSLCCNPDHLYVGTQRENMQDKVRKGRHPKGDDHHFRRDPSKVWRGPQNTSGKICALDFERFSKRYVVQPNGCWTWTGSVDHRGYGVFHLLKQSDGAHRNSFRMYKGEIPKGLVVRHLCHNKLCVNPDHLLTGTYKENMQDSIDAGVFKNKTRSLASRKAMSGEFCKRAKLKEAQVIQIIKNPSGKSDEELAAEFNVGAPNIKCIRARKTWKFLEIV